MSSDMDRHITGNYGEDFFTEDSSQDAGDEPVQYVWAVWEPIDGRPDYLLGLFSSEHRAKVAAQKGDHIDKLRLDP